MDYRKISFELKLNKHLKAIPKEFIIEWKKVIKALVMAPFVKQLEPHPDATDFYDVFIFIDGPKQYIMKIDEDRSNIFFSNEYPYFLSSLEKTPNCELQNPIALSINEKTDLISFSCSAYFELLMTLKNKKLISPSKISYLMRCLNIYQTSFLKEIDLQLLSTEYFKDVWGFYQSVLQMDKEFHYDEEQGIRIERIPSLNAVIIKRTPYQEIYFLNQYKKMFVIPIDYGKNSIGFFNKNMDFVKIIEALDSPLAEYIYPPGSFVSIIDYSGIPYELKGISPNFIKAHHMTIFQAHKLIYSNM